MQSTFNLDLLVPAGRALLMGAFAISLVLAMRERTELSAPFERLVIGFLGLIFFLPFSGGLDALADQMTEMLSRAGSRDDLKQMIWEALKASSRAPTRSGDTTVFNIPAVLEQIWRTGVWGVMASITEFVFLLSSLLLESARDIFWKILLFLFPLAWGLFPLVPRLAGSFVQYLIELALWQPVLVMVEILASQVARDRWTKVGSLGLPIVAVELIASILILLIPSVTHRIVSGAFSGDMGTTVGAIATAVKFKKAARAAAISIGEWPKLKIIKNGKATQEAKKLKNSKG